MQTLAAAMPVPGCPQWAVLRCATNLVLMLVDCPSADLESIIAATAELVAQVQKHQEAAAQISGLSVQCGGAPVVVAELEALAGWCTIVPSCALVRRKRMSHE